MEPMNFKTKRQNIISEGESSVVDIISNLPDSVLSHILSFLPITKEAVATSILSKRWRYVWTYVDKLIYDSSNLLAKARKQLPRFVDKVLKLHQGNIKGFTLSGHGVIYNEFNVISWINTVVSRGVERLHVDISFSDGSPKWPLSIFSCKTLVDLKMRCLERNSMDIPSTPIFPCLKKLQVSHCGNGFLRGIVSRCLALEHFIGSVGWTPIDIVSSSMKRLQLHCDTSNHIDHKIVLCVPSLEYLKINCALPIQLIAEQQLSSLIEADIFFWEYHAQNVNTKDLRDSFVRFIQPNSNVKLLRIRFHCCNNTFYNSVGEGLFVNLTKLEIVSSFFVWGLLLSFMENSINLEAITLKKTYPLKKHELAWKEPKKVPTSLSSSLRKISIHGYGEEELPMVRYVLRTDQILERVDIHCANSYRDNDEWKSDMYRNLQNFHRACERCKIVLV